ncbi:hypothetical protein IQ06DRAFT_350564 [Phaeosphaeriaceae sp. SRC1lsM3a]|nr:hypothetical protein IQ06DRAFT_350564 [Stagonospora sp. SRC1lsM3a]
MAMVHEPLRIFPDYSLEPQDILLMLLTKHVNHVYHVHRDINKLEMNNLSLSGRQGLGRPQDSCFLIAWIWYKQLDNEEQRINTKVVRRHLLKILPVESSKSGFLRNQIHRLRSRYRFWYMFPNDSLIWILHFVVAGWVHKLRNYANRPNRNNVDETQHIVFADSGFSHGISCQ